jgi:polyhydroxyalkanoate synthesis regulator protein
MTRQNLALFENAMAMFSPFGVGAGAAARPKPEPAPEKPSASEVDSLKQEMEAMRRQLAELSQRK